jgi:hypothetical protein
MAETVWYTDAMWGTPAPFALFGPVELRGGRW